MAVKGFTGFRDDLEIIQGIMLDLNNGIMLFVGELYAIALVNEYNSMYSVYLIFLFSCSESSDWNNKGKWDIAGAFHFLTSWKVNELPAGDNSVLVD